jgi:hypothetical protein
VNGSHQFVKRVGRRRVLVTLAGKYRPNVEPEQVVHDRRASNDNIPLNASIAHVTVDDPFSSAGESGKITAVRSLRDDRLAWLQSHRRINRAQFKAGRCWERDYIQSAIGHVRTNFPRGPRVGGGRSPDALTETMLTASRRLEKANAALKDRAALVYDVIARGMPLKDIAAARGDRSADAVSDLSYEFRAALDVLAAHYGSSQ